MIRFGDEKDVEPITELWNSVFGDDRTLISKFIEYFSCTQALVYCLNGEIASMMFLPEISICQNNERLKANYIYALCTKEQYRGRGFASELIKFSKIHSLENNVPYTVVRPATRHLFDYYRKLGFEYEYFRIKKDLTIDGSLLYNKKDLCLQRNIAFCEWSDTGIKYAESCGYVKFGGYAAPADLFLSNVNSSITEIVGCFGSVEAVNSIITELYISKMKKQCKFLLPDVEVFTDFGIRERYLSARLNINSANAIENLYFGMTFE